MNKRKSKFIKFNGVVINIESIKSIYSEYEDNGYSLKINTGMKSEETIYRICTGQSKKFVDNLINDYMKSLN